MQKTVILFSAVAFSTAAYASDLEQECLEVSEIWESTGDVDTQCSCLAEAVDGDDDLTAEFMEFRTKFSNDSEAYEGSSDAAKEVMDSCSVES